MRVAVVTVTVYGTAPSAMHVKCRSIMGKCRRVPAGRTQYSAAQVKKGASGDIGGLQPRFGQKGSLYASGATTHTLEVREAGEAVVPYGESDVAAWKRREEVTGMPVGSWVTMPAKVLWAEMRPSPHLGPFVVATVEYMDGRKEQVRMFGHKVADVPVHALVVMHGLKVDAVTMKDESGYWVANPGGERSVQCTTRFALEVVAQDVFVMSLFG